VVVEWACRGQVTEDEIDGTRVGRDLRDPLGPVVDDDLLHPDAGATFEVGDLGLSDPVDVVDHPESRGSLCLRGEGNGPGHRPSHGERGRSPQQFGAVHPEPALRDALADAEADSLHLLFLPAHRRPPGPVWRVNRIDERRSNSVESCAR